MGTYPSSGGSTQAGSDSLSFLFYFIFILFFLAPLVWAEHDGRGDPANRGQFFQTRLALIYFGLFI